MVWKRFELYDINIFNLNRIPRESIQLLRKPFSCIWFNGISINPIEECYK